MSKSFYLYHFNITCIAIIIFLYLACWVLLSSPLFRHENTHETPQAEESASEMLRSIFLASCEVPVWQF